MTGSKTSARTKAWSKPDERASGRQSSLSALIEKALEGREADPHVIAKRLLPKLPPEVLGELALAGLVDRVSKAVQMKRTGGLVAPRSEGRSKWSVALRVCPAGDWKMLEDCDLSDLQALAAQHREIAAQNVARAEEYDQLAAELRAAGVRTVGELWAAREDLAA